MISIESLSDSLKDPGFKFVPRIDLQRLIGSPMLARWDAFASSWDHLETDLYMAGGGRFRSRRFARFTMEGGTVTRLPHGPHFQTLDYNPLNGGKDRWFEPISDLVAAHPITRRIFAICDEAFSMASPPPASRAWVVEAHQFRIASDEREIGLPTPEGMHRDGVDWVFVALIARAHVAGGVTGIVDEAGRSLGSFKLEEPLDAVFLDDHRVWHGVTPIEPLVPGRPAHRDALVVTFRAA